MLLCPSSSAVMLFLTIFDMCENSNWLARQASFKSDAGTNISYQYAAAIIQVYLYAWHLMPLDGSLFTALTADLLESVPGPIALEILSMVSSHGFAFCHVAILVLESEWPGTLNADKFFLAWHRQARSYLDTR